ncbi:MAG: alanyl-tRNA synthetase [Dehalococcoides mccartyi]|nr:alanyl-tRNA synthetase [Dehalococcoides mccartyi]MEA2121330.1 Alanine--tRNA ligase [Dehalococcoides mccartyi]MEA2121968.1 Alanine--tRNA ligase [Dehalococcoides mccartyi]
MAGAALFSSDELRENYLKFFEEKGHKRIASSSLIPHNDPTLLLTTAGMVQFKPYYLGVAKPENPRMTSCQKCFRTTDIESVGDASHLTMFEMLGNFSIGNYFKKEAIAWAWEYVTQRLNIPAEKLWVTVYLDDDEAIALWKEQGVPEGRIVRLGAADNFWGPAGDSGPCGPCSEIHYDFGQEMGCGKADCNPSCKCGRFCEIWNLVFVQFNQDKSGKRQNLPAPSIDTGMGLERLTILMQARKNVYETDIFAPVIEKACQLSGRQYGIDAETDKALRIVSEHSRGITFLIADGVIPDKAGRGYVLRRLLRRAVLFGRRLGLEKPFLVDMAGAVIARMSGIYPELNKRQAYVLEMIASEEARFSETLATGLELLEEIVRQTKGGQISGQDAFKLYDTYGFPVEMTTEIAAERGLSVDLGGFEAEMEVQRTKARSSRKFSFDAAATAEAVKNMRHGEKTCFVGYELTRQKSTIMDILTEGGSVDSIEEGDEASIVLDESPFYAEMGGQVGDTGEIITGGGRFEVKNTLHLPNGVFLHQGRVISGCLKISEAAAAHIDEERRRDIARNHTATHILQTALRQVLGEQVQQRGSVVTPERLRFDFSHLKPMTKDEIRRVEEFVNDKIRRNLPVYAEEMPYRHALEEGVTALFGEKYGDRVRVLRVGRPAVSAELCGGTHVSASGEISLFKIVSESSVGAGLRRIEAVTGREAEAYINLQQDSLSELSGMLEAAPEESPRKLAELKEEIDTLKKTVQNLERQLSRGEAEELLSKSEDYKGIKLLVSRMTSVNTDTLRETADFLRDKLGSGVIVLGTVSEDKPFFLCMVTPDLIEKGYHAGNIVKKLSQIAGGGGGGKPNMAQGGGRDKAKLDEALQAVKGML